uniref:C3H1-type domain-containing protein n=1 Tax=Glossina brevipalpis TaxID=37001 RepID=A0A1A9WJY4_9MUSC
MLSLVADYHTSSSSNGDDSDQEIDRIESNNKEVKTTITKTKLLPSASDLLKSTSCRTQGEVFTNKFLEAEKAEIDKLQKHVKMVESEDHVTEKNGRKICWNNRRGRCRFGSKCKYAHESDLIVDENKKEKAAPSPPKIVINAISKPACSNIMPKEPSGKAKARKRPGLNDSIEPSKRIMKNYTRIKRQQNSIL